MYAYTFCTLVICICFALIKCYYEKIDERTKSDKELISKIVDEMNLDTEQINIEKAVRLGRRKDDPQPLVITFSTLTAKRVLKKCK